MEGKREQDMHKNLIPEEGNSPGKNFCVTESFRNILQAVWNHLRNFPE